VKKIKVTKRVRAKIPWYERPPLLFGALAILLGLGGLLMARVNWGGGGKQSVLGDNRADSTLVPGGQAVDWHAQAPGVLELGDALPNPNAGEALPPVRVETLIEAPEARQLLRETRGLQPAKDGGAALYGCAPAVVLAAQQETGSVQQPDWAAKTLKAECESCCDFEIHRDSAGQLYLLGFVSLEVGEAIAEAGPRMDFPAPRPTPQKKWWEIWKKKAAEEKIIARGSLIDIYPDLQPDQVCVVVLPLERVEIMSINRAREGVARPVEYLQVRLK